MTAFRHGSARTRERWLALVLMTSAAFAPKRADAEERVRTPDLRRPRELDALGVRAFRDGRYRDAIRFFEEAYRLGAPSIELWNIARCHQRLDEPEEQEQMLERYLAESDLLPQDRAEATRELTLLRHRPSLASVDSDRRGAAVLVDGRRVPGTTPVIVSLAPGEHRIAVEKGGARYEQAVTARHGRAILVRAPLGGDVDGEPAASAAFVPARRTSFGLDLGGFAPSLGGNAAPIAPALGLTGRVRLVREPRWDVAVGIRGYLTEIRWHRGALADESTPNCALPRAYRASELAAVAHAGGELRLGPRWAVGGETGGGIDLLTGDRAGGEAFAPTCNPRFGARPLLHAALEISHRLTPALRVVLTPVVFQIHPAFGGARETPIDATGAWWRIGAFIGIAMEL